MPTTVDLIAGALWSFAYLLIIKRGYEDKSCGMPVLALCGNFAWELLALTLRVKPEITPGAYMWVPPDAVIFVQCLMYGRDDFANPFIKKHFRPIVLLTFAYAFVFLFLFETRLHDDHRYYSGYCDNLVMSALFIAMLLRRGSSRGQSMYIALSKLLGTVVISVECLRLAPRPEPAFMALLAAGILTLDALYAVMLYGKLREERHRPLDPALTTRPPSPGRPPRPGGCSPGCPRRRSRRRRRASPGRLAARRACTRAHEREVTDAHLRARARRSGRPASASARPRAP